MLDSRTYKRESRRLSLALNRAERARRLVPANPYSNELEGKGLELVNAYASALERLQAVASEGLAIFELEGSPDNWARWDQAKRDSAFALERFGWEHAGLAEAHAIVRARHV